MTIRFLPEADRELHEALEWYAEQKVGLETEFMRCIDEAICRILANPKMYPIAIKNARKALVKRFPYIIYYEIANEEIIIFAVFHSKQNPKRWQRRV